MSQQPGNDELKKLEPQSVRNALRELGLSKIELAVALLLLDKVHWNKVNWKVWKTETQDGQPLRISVRTLARLCGYSRRHVARGLRSLEWRELVVTDGGVYQPNLYALCVERIMDWLPERRGKPQLAMACSAKDLDAVRVPRRDAGRARRLAEAAAEAAAGVEQPSWAQRAAGQFHRPVTLVLDVVRQVAAVVLGSGEHELGPLARPILRLWDRLARPTAADAARRVRLVVQASMEECSEQAILSLRGLRVAWKRHPKHGSLPTGLVRFADDHTRDVGAVCALGPWASRWQAAERHAAKTCTCKRHAPPEDPPPTAAPEVDELLGEARAAPALVVADAKRRWAEASAALRQELGESDWAIWVKPLKVAGVKGAALVLFAPNRHYVEWISAHYAGSLEALVGAPVELLVRRASAPPPES